jgi:opacity protein-like surface antigen
MLGGLVAVTGAGSARAGEATPRDPWSGAYVGVMGAFSRSVIKGATLKADGTFGSNASQESAQVNDRAAGLGVFAGWRRRFDPGIVVGVEADVMGLNHDATNVNLLAANAQPVATVRYETGLLATARMTAGWTFGDILVYGTGGLALAPENETRTQYRLIAGTNVAQFSETSDATRAGFALGAGAEWRIIAGWSLRADYLYVRFADATFRFPDARGGAQGSFTSVQGRTADNSAHMNLVRIGISYAFGAGD